MPYLSVHHISPHCVFVVYFIDLHGWQMKILSPSVLKTNFRAYQNSPYARSVDVNMSKLKQPHAELGLNC